MMTLGVTAAGSGGEKMVGRISQAWFYWSFNSSSSLRETAKNSVHTSTYTKNIRTHIQLIMRGECCSQPHLYIRQVNEHFTHCYNNPRTHNVFNYEIYFLLFL